MPALAALVAAQASAQTSWSASAETDYRFRGVSLSDGRPAAHLNVAYDAPTGWYAGGSVSTVDLEGDARSAGLLAFAGFARRAFDQASWETGVTVSHFARDAHYDYGEVYAGMSAQSWSARLYLSPDYFGQSVRTAYLELNAHADLSSALRVFGHLGLLGRLSAPAAYGASFPPRGDARVGIATTVGPLELRFARVAVSSSGSYPSRYEQDHGTWVLSVSWSP